MRWNPAYSSQLRWSWRASFHFGCATLAGPRWLHLNNCIQESYLDFMSHHPLAHKLAVVKTLHSRAGAICSNVTAKDQETRHIRQAFISNGYPRGVIQHHATPAHKRSTDDQSQGPVVTLELPYVRGLSEVV